MNIAQSILSIEDRTPRERRLMAELRHIGPVDWAGDILVCRFIDGSALMVLGEDLCPIEYLVVESTEERGQNHA
jgi:hypothetical protein